MNTFEGTLDIYYASAGTGKTRKLLDIIDTHLQQGVPIDRIAFVTFTKKGAEVAKLRTAIRFGYSPNKLKNFRTIHSMAFRACGASKAVMMDFDKYKDFGIKAGYDFGKVGFNSNEGVNWYEKQDQQLITLEQLYRNNKPYCEKIIDDRVSYKELSTFMCLYKKYKDTFAYVDFTDLLEKYIKEGIYEDVDIVCLDEMQDSTLLQWQLVFQAFHKAKHIYVAGDEKQAVFTWAGASPETLLNLRGTHHILETSYRVPSAILSYANNIADNIKESHHSHCKANIQGGKVKFLVDIEEITREFDKNKSYFFLTRNKKFYKYFIDWCKEHFVPYKVNGVPYISATEKLEFREGKTEHWDPEKLDFAVNCHLQGTLYNEPLVNISTIHTVKGDEADVVVLLSDISKAVSSQLDIDEDSEHRVFYVATTRAKETLYVIEPQTKLYYPYLF